MKIIDMLALVICWAACASMFLVLIALWVSGKSVALMDFNWFKTIGLPFGEQAAETIMAGLGTIWGLRYIWKTWGRGK